MKGFALLVAALLGAGLLYVTTATGGQQQAPSRAEFNALKKQVATLRQAVNGFQNFKNFTADCIDGRAGGHAVPVTFAPTWHLSQAGETADLWVLTTNVNCAKLINGEPAH
jgi:hypothetical protein